MKTLAILLPWLLCAVVPASARTTACGTQQTIGLANGFRLANNNWGSEGVAGSPFHCVYRDPDDSIGWYWNRPPASGAPLPDFPQILHGPKPFGGGTGATELLPIQVKDIQSIMTWRDGTHETAGSAGPWTHTISMWFTSVRPGGHMPERITHEIMINIATVNYQSGGGNATTPNAVNDGFRSYHHAESFPMSHWRIHIFNLAGDQRPLPTRINIKAFLDYLRQNETLTGDDWLACWELGDEMNDHTLGEVHLTTLAFGVNGARRSPTAALVPDYDTADWDDWRRIDPNDLPTTQTITPGIYRMKPAHSELPVEVENASTADGARVLQATLTNQTQQQWLLSYIGNGQYEIINRLSGKVLEASNGRDGNGVQLVQASRTGTPHQRWYLQERINGRYRIIAAHSRMVADLAGFSQSPGAAAQQWQWGNTSNQLWMFNFVEGFTPDSAPTLGAITDRTIPANGTTGAIPLGVGHPTADPGAVTLAAWSSNTTLVPLDRIGFGGGGANRSVTVTPATNRTGSALITVCASYGTGFAVSQFTVTVEPSGTPMIFSFDSGTLDGWADLTPPNSNTGPRNWALAPPAFPGNTQSGAGAVGQNIVGGNQDSSHPTLRLRSPEFSLNGTGDLSAWLRGGAGSGSLAGTAVSALPANSASHGFQGIALRNATTGQYVLSARRGSSGDNWQQVALTTAELAALDQDARYTLDLIDQGHGGWGWVAMDSVTIPGSTGVPNTAPAITAIADQTIDANTQAGPLAFTVDDAETNPALLTLAAASSDTTLVPAANIVFGGSGTNRSVTVTPAAGQSGSATITITASDGELTADTAFVLTVLPGPDPLVFDFDDATLQGWTTVSGSADQQVFAAKTHGPLFNSSPDPQAGSHMVGVNFGYNPPIDSPWDGAHQTMWIRSPEFTLNGAGNLTAWLTGGSQTWNSGVHPMANTSDVPANSLNGTGFMGIALRQVESGNFVALRGLPADNAFGWTQVTIPAAELAPYANDGKSYTLDFIDARHGGYGLIALDSVTIPGEVAGNQAPTISGIPDQSIPRNTNTGAIAFIIGDDTTAPQDLILAKASSNPTLVPTANIVFGGSGTNRTVTVTPASGLVGEATITITVSDGAASTPRSFLLNVFGERITYDFDDGTLQGWEVVSTDALGRQLFAIVPPASPSPNITPHSGGHFLGLQVPAFTMDPPAYTQDSGHDTLWMRSPEFKLSGSGENLTAWLCGGHGYGADATGKLVANVPAQTFDDPGNAIFPSFLGIALRNVDTGVFVLAGTKASPGSDWQQVTFTAAQLAALDQDATYTLDLLDVRQGGWGWVNLDTVAIPGIPVEPPPPPVDSFADWAATMGLSGAAAAFDADPDGDGIANGLEFVLGGQPNPANPGWNSLHLLPTAETQDNHLVFTFRRAKQAAYLNPTVEFSDDLVPPWTTAVHGSNATITVADDDAFETVTVTIPKDGLPALFARLSVLEPSQ